MKSERDFIICLLDVLGFENLFAKLGLEKIQSKYEELIEVANKHNFELAITIGPEGHPRIGNPGIKSAYFSDTLLFWCPYDVFRLEVILNSMSEVICRLIELGLPLRGAVSVGKVVIDKERGIYLGQPIISAARAETVQRWIGVTLSKAFDVQPYNGGFKADVILQYDKHLKPDSQLKVIPLVLDYPRHWRISRKTSLTKAVEKLNLDPQYAEYYENTISFVDHSEQNHDWWVSHPEYEKTISKSRTTEEKTP